MRHNGLREINVAPAAPCSSVLGKNHVSILDFPLQLRCSRSAFRPRRSDASMQFPMPNLDPFEERPSCNVGLEISEFLFALVDIDEMILIRSGNVAFHYFPRLVLTIISPSSQAVPQRFFSSLRSAHGLQAIINRKYPPNFSLEFSL